jgi:peroxiredoxin
MTKKKHLNFNAPAPDLELLDPSGKPVRLSSLWGKKPLLLAFSRHFGCTQCKEMLEKLVAGKEAIEKAGLGLVIIMQGTPEDTAEFAQHFAPGILVLADPERKAYQAYGL